MTEGRWVPGIWRGNRQHVAVGQEIAPVRGPRDPVRDAVPAIGPSLQWNVGGEHCVTAWLRFDRERAPEGPDPLVHAGEAQPTSRHQVIESPGCVESLLVVADDYSHTTGPGLHVYGHARRPGVPPDVLESLLNDVEERAPPRATAVVPRR